MSETLPSAAKRLAGFLNECGAGAVIGGLAIIARVKARSTDDLDVVIAAPPSDVTRILEVARRHGYRWDESHVPDFVEMGLMRLAGESYGLDVILADSDLLAAVVARATPVSFEETVLPVATLEDLVLLKLDANRPIDIDDVLSIKDAFGAALDYVYLRDAATRAGILDRLDLYFGDDFKD